MLINDLHAEFEEGRRLVAEADRACKLVDPVPKPLFITYYPNSNDVQGIVAAAGEQKARDTTGRGPLENSNFQWHATE